MHYVALIHGADKKSVLHRSPGLGAGENQGYRLPRTGGLHGAHECGHFHGHDGMGAGRLVEDFSALEVVAAAEIFLA